MNQQEKEQEAKLQKIEAECFCEIINSMMLLLLHPDRYIKFWEEVRLIREKYLRKLKDQQ